MHSAGCWVPVVLNRYRFMKRICTCLITECLWRKSVVILSKATSIDHWHAGVARALCFIIQQQQFWIHSIQCPQLSLAQFQNTNWTISATDHTIQNIRGPCPLQSRSLPSTRPKLEKGDPLYHRTIIHCITVWPWSHGWIRRRYVGGRRLGEPKDVAGEWSCVGWITCTAARCGSTDRDILLKRCKQLWAKRQLYLET
jgi:hypothetical protein